MFVLDTNVVSELRKAKAGKAAWTGRTYRGGRKLRTLPRGRGRARARAGVAGGAGGWGAVFGAVGGHRRDAGAAGYKRYLAGPSRTHRPSPKARLFLAQMHHILLFGTSKLFFRTMAECRRTAHDF